MGAWSPSVTQLGVRNDLGEHLPQVCDSLRQPVDTGDHTAGLSKPNISIKTNQSPFVISKIQREIITNTIIERSFFSM